MDAVGCIQSRVSTSGTNLNLCFSCFLIEMHPYFFAPLAEHPCRLLVPAGLCGCSSTGCTVLAMGQEQPFVPLGRAQPRGLEPSAVPLRGSAWSKKILQKTLILILFHQMVPSHPVKSGTSHPISHYRCAVAKRSEMMDSFWMFSNTEQC